MALSIQITKVTPLTPSAVWLQWTLNDPSESGTYLFTIKRSGAIEGPWEELAADQPDTYYYTDDLTVQPNQPASGRVHLFSFQRQIYYRVTVTPPSGAANAVTSEVHGLETELAPIQKGLRRRLKYDEWVLFRRHNGVRLVILKRKTWGTRCTDCYDSLTRATTKEHCSTCYGTSFEGGYWDPVVTYGRINTPKNVTAQTSSRDKIEAAPHVITLPDTMLIQDLDLIIESDTNLRHVVRRQTRTELRRKSVHQQVTTSLAEDGAVEYSIPVNLRTTSVIQ